MGSSRWLTWTSLGVIVAVFLARVSAIVEPLGPDQGVYATIGWAMQHGFALYRDLFEMKPPGLYVTYRAGFALFGTSSHAIFWMDYAAALLTMAAVFDLSRRIAGLRFAALAAAVFALGTWPAARLAYGGFLERTINETFISLLAAAAMWAAAVAGPEVRNRWAIASGAFIGLAAVFKPMAIVYWPAAVAWIWFQADFPRARRFAVCSAAGAVVPPAIAIAWMWATGIMPDAWLALAVYNGAYLTLGDVGLFDLLNRFAHEVFRRMKTDEVWALGTVAAAVAVGAWRWRHSRSALVAALGVFWLGAALAAIVLNGPRMFQTYFMPALVPLCLLGAWLLDQAFAPGRRWRVATAALVVGLLAIMLVRSGSPRRAADVTRADTLQLFGSSERQEYLRRFQSRATQAFSAADAETLADYLRAKTEPNERVFIFGMTASAYFLSGRLPASRFLFVYPAVSNMADRPEFRVETLAAELARSAPRYIVLQRHNRDSFSGWRADVSFAAPPMAALLQEYRQETEIGDYALYRRN
ncbi:MAG TPA: glycosyltransferase family 39 protein [Vicinamibacterales bacterium]|nr:glycosyltransferase family 39 protein [Vicinamibacterales bacterium]